MARDLSDKEVLKMELEQLQKEMKNERIPVRTGWTVCLACGI